MDRNTLHQQIIEKQSFLCVGLDPDMSKLPAFFDKNDPNSILEFNKAVINATKDLCVAYKFNIAFYECLGPVGWDILEKSLGFIPKSHFTIADAKRGDIGNTSKKYAETFFSRYDFDAVTVAPYMGHDSVKPFLGYPGKWVILLALTSNPGSTDFQMQQFGADYLFEMVLKESKKWADADQLMYVVGATKSDYLSRVRSIVPDHFLLVPGVGAQGGSLEEVARLGMNDHTGLLVNSSRGILYAGNDQQFSSASRDAASSLQSEMARILKQG